MDADAFHYTGANRHSACTVRKAVPQSIDSRGHAIWIHASTPANICNCEKYRHEGVIVVCVCACVCVCVYVCV